MKASLGKASWAKHIDFTVIDLICLAVAFVVAYVLKFNDFSFIDSSSWKGLLAMLLLVNLVLTLFTNPYSGVFRRRYWEDVGACLMLALESFLVACVVFYLLKIGEDYSREMLLTTYAIYLVISLLAKFLHKKRLLDGKIAPAEDRTRRVVVVTTVSGASDAEKLVLAEDMKAHEVVGFCLVDGWGANAMNDRQAAPVEGLARLCMLVNADEVLVLVNAAYVKPEIYEELIEDGVRVSFGISEALGVSSEAQAVGRVGVLKTLDLERYSFGSGQMLYLPVKRAFDIVLGILGCILAAIVAGAVKIATLATGDTHPIFYKQARVGLRGRQFNLWKLRSMVWNADEALQELLEDPELRAQWERDQKLEDDPRITKIGRFLRRTSLDELPQFWNVLKGEMSVVGPRPLVPGELEEHGGRALYNKVKPGITGWWGCNGRSNIEYRERLELEYHYVKHCSLYLDLLCVFRTAIAVLKKDGAV